MIPGSSAGLQDLQTQLGSLAVDTEAPPGEAPPWRVPRRQQDKRVSPFDVEGQGRFVSQVAEAEVFLQWCRHLIDRYDQYMQTAPQDVQGRIREVLRKLAEKVKEGARVQAIGEGSLEVAAPLYLVFEVIIPVM